MTEKPRVSNPFALGAAAHIDRDRARELATEAKPQSLARRAANVVVSAIDAADRRDLGCAPCKAARAKARTLLTRKP